MKKLYIFFLLIIPTFLFAQSDFSPSEYVNFIQQNKSLTAAELLGQYPPQTTYYSSRQHLPDLAQIPWFDTINKVLNLTTDERAMLEQQYFMVTERWNYETWLSAFVHLYNDDLPLFLSTDFILFTLHQSYDEILKNIEFQVLEPNLIVLLESMYAYFPSLYDKYDDEPDMIASLEDVDLYLAAANSLITGSEVLPQRGSVDAYNSLMEAIEAEKMVEMPLFTFEPRTRKLDFSQFTPRGHYTDEIYISGGEPVSLEKYFKTMMFLGRIDFLLTAPPENPWETDWTEAELKRMNLSALLLNEVLLNSGKKDLFDLHEEIISFMVGPDDNMTPDELDVLCEDSLMMSSVADVLDDDTFGKLSVLLNGSDDYGQKIMSNFFFVDPDVADPGELPVSYKLLGQKFLIDSYVFSEVVYDRISFEGEKVYRALPDPLDFLSVFGSEDAMALMEEEMDSLKYAYKINELKYMVDAYDDDFWTQSLYNNWLSALIQLNPPDDATDLPYFMQTAAWHHEKLNTQLTSWAQLRHDNILYGKQSYTGGTGCSFPYTYLEPYPEFYHWIEVFSDNALAFFDDKLDAYPDLETRITDYYGDYGAIMAQLKEIALKERSKTALSSEELIFLKTMINDYMSSGPSVNGWILDLLFPAMDQWDFDYTVADVHTQPTDEFGAVVGNVLHVGNGNINLGVFIAPNTARPDGHICYVGPVGSFHTKVETNFKRLNDIEWKEMFLNGKVPERPDWVRTYLADADGEMQPSDRVLKGVEYTGQSIVEGEYDPVSYLLAYPNPAIDEVHFRFILNEDTRLTADIYDIAGRKLCQLYSGKLNKAEHDLTFSLENEEAGIYFIRVKANDRFITRKFVVQK